MNKKFLIVFALFTVVHLVRCTESEEILNKIKNKHLKKLISGKLGNLDTGLEKLDEKCPGASEKLKAALISFSECDDKADDSLTICEALQKYTLNCTAPLLKVVEDCIPEKAKGLPTLGVKSLLSAADFLCKQSGESLFELVNPCFFEEPEEHAHHHECEQKIENIAAKYNHTVPEKTEICTDITSLRDCIHNHANHACKNQKTKNVITGLYDAIVAPCSHINEL